MREPTPNGLSCDAGKTVAIGTLWEPMFDVLSLQDCEAGEAIAIGIMWELDFDGLSLHSCGAGEATASGTKGVQKSKGLKTLVHVSIYYYI